MPALGDRPQLVRHETRGEHAVPRLADERRDVDAHRADHRAAAADRARVVEEVLPFLQLADRHRMLQVQRAIEPGERPDLALVRLLERLELPDRRVLRVARLHVEVTRLGAVPAMDARLHVHGGGAAHVLRECLHRRREPLGVGALALLVVADLGLPDREALRLEVDRMLASTSLTARLPCGRTRHRCSRARGTPGTRARASRTAATRAATRATAGGSRPGPDSAAARDTAGRARG